MAVLCLGEALIDLVPPSGMSPENAQHLSILPGGAPLNVCIGLTRLGREARFLGCLSSDGFGRRLARLLDDAGIQRRPTRAVPEPTRLAVIDHSNPDTPFRFYGDAPADSSLTIADVDAALEQFDVTGLYASSLMMTEERPATVQKHAVERAATIGLPVYADPNPRPASWSSPVMLQEASVYLLQHCTLAKLSLDDARVLGWPNDLETLFGWWSERFAGRLFLTGGSEGCWMQIDGRIANVRPPLVEPVDPTGAGDASFAALISRLHGGSEPTEFDLRFAAVAGALATLKPGAIAGLPTRSEVEAYL